MNMKCKAISITPFKKIKILRNNFDLLRLFLYCFNTMPLASTQHVDALSTVCLKFSFVCDLKFNVDIG